MIRFNCAHCGWAVRVANICAGKKGRCPSCKGVVSIPHYSVSGIDDPPPISIIDSSASRLTDSGTPRLEDLAAAVGSPEDSSVDRPAPPPPMTAQDSFIEEMERGENQDPDAAEETDIIPTDQLNLPAPDAPSGPPQRRRIFSVLRSSPRAAQPPAHVGTYPPAGSGPIRRHHAKDAPTLDDISELRRMRVYVFIAVVAMVLIVLAVAAVLLLRRRV